MIDKGLHVVTGAAGFIGSAFLGKLNSQGVENIIVVDNLSGAEKWKNLRGKFFSDYLHKTQFLSALQSGSFRNKIRSITHLGACSSTTETDCEYLMQNNFRYSKELAEYAIEHSIRFIYASSAATYGNGSLGYSDNDQVTLKLSPLNPYGFSKQLFDLWALSSGASQKIAGLKFFNVFGPNEYHKGAQRSVAYQAYHQIKSDGCVRLYKSYNQAFKDGEQQRDFIYIKDCLEVLWLLLNNLQVNGIFNLGTGQAQTWNNLAIAIFSALGLKPKIEYVEMPEQLRKQYQYYTQADMTKLKSALPDIKFSPLNLAVDDYVNGFLEKNAAVI